MKHFPLTKMYVRIVNFEREKYVLDEIWFYCDSAFFLRKRILSDAYEMSKL